MRKKHSVAQSAKALAHAIAFARGKIDKDREKPNPFGLGFRVVSPAPAVRQIARDILKDKFNEAVVGSVLFIIAAILYKALLNGLFDAIESNVKIFLIMY